MLWPRLWLWGGKTPSVSCRVPPALCLGAVGKKNGRDAEAIVEVIDYFDEATGFTAMERRGAAIVAEMMAAGQTPHGAGGAETQVPARPFVEKFRRRGIDVKEQVI